jgi:hypothetical protein
MIESVLAVIRSSGERTTNLCKQLLARQIPEKNIVVIRESPFRKAVIRTFECGLEYGLPWTFALDADTLILENALHSMLVAIENSEENVFEVQGQVMDKLFACARAAGQHIYRTSLFEKALKLIPPDSVSMRPETYTLGMMANQGQPWIQNDLLLGLHDFEQYYRDIYRKAFQHAKKHRRSIKYLKTLWKRLGGNDPDYLVALMGLEAGIKHKGSFRVDIRNFDSSQIFQGKMKNIQEKDIFPPNIIGGYNVDSIIEDFKLHISQPVSVDQRLFSLYKEKGIFYVVRRLFEKGSKILKSL